MFICSCDFFGLFLAANNIAHIAMVDPTMTHDRSVEVFPDDLSDGPSLEVMPDDRGDWSYEPSLEVMLDELPDDDQSYRAEGVELPPYADEGEETMGCVDVDVDVEELELEGTMQRRRSFLEIS